MSKLEVIDAAGQAAGEFEVDDGLLVLDKGEQAVHDCVVAHLAGRRAGTASTLTKGEVAGSNKKPWRQKGTGRARAGYRQSPVWRGGAVAFGPRPRSYARKINRKVVRLAFRRALSDKIDAGAVRIVEALELGEPKTKLLADNLKAWGTEAPALLVVAEVSRNLGLASRNIANLAVVRAGDVSTYQVMRYPRIVATREAMEQLVGRLGGDVPKGGES